MKINKDLFLGILFFSTLWGISEAGLGGVLYRHNVPYASSYVTIIAFAILSFAKVYLPHKWSGSMIGAIAMLYKFLNTPFYACHLLAIFILGVSFDLIFSILRVKNKAIGGAAATYLGYGLFGLTITYVFRYQYWITEGFLKILKYVGTSGTISSLANAFIVPLSFRLANNLKSRQINLYMFRSRLATSSMSLVIAAFWVLGAINYCSVR